jgi:hypothetical protein
MRKLLCFRIVMFGRYYAVPSLRTCTCNMCKYLLLCVLEYLCLLVVYLHEVAGCSACCVMLRVPLADVC